MKFFLSHKFKRILITGGAGFIGSNFIKELEKNLDLCVFNLDKISYSSDIKFANKFNIKNNNTYKFLKVDLTCESKINDAIEFAKPDLIINFAAESHVDRSITDPRIFLQSNTIGTFNLLEASRNYWNQLPLNKKNLFKFIHVSTDEVFGSLENEGRFSENSQYQPSSPYSASKAASDHFVMSWFKTYKFPSIISNCSNNYGPRQFPEKFIPLIIQKIINNSKIPIYGNGNNIRDWLFVKDHVNALIKIANDGENGARYCIGGGQEIPNIELVKLICEKMDKKLHRNQESLKLITHVPDRPGHDYRYSIDYSLIKDKLNWSPDTPLEKGIEKTLDWYLNNQLWCKEIVEKSKYNLQRLGI